jgi:hypothetical protein
MNALRMRMLSAALAVVLSRGAAVQAQGTASHGLVSAPSMTAGTATGASQSTGAAAATTSNAVSPASDLSSGLGMPMMALSLPFFANSAANGSANAGGLAGATTAAPSNLFANPYAAPLVYGSMLPGLGNQATAQGQTASDTSAGTLGTSMGLGAMGVGGTQLGLMMLATQRPLGIGSGQLGGARSGPGSDRQASRNPATAGRGPRPAPHPGGLAARYFNRTGPRSPYPQNYYNRQNRYFP